MRTNSGTILTSELWKRRRRRRVLAKRSTNAFKMVLFPYVVGLRQFPVSTRLPWLSKHAAFLIHDCWMFWYSGYGNNGTTIHWHKPAIVGCLAFCALNKTVSITLLIHDIQPNHVGMSSTTLMTPKTTTTISKTMVFYPFQPKNTKSCIQQYVPTII